MIKKLRRRFLTVLMTLLVLLMAGVLAAIYIFMYRAEMISSRQIMDFAFSASFFRNGAPDRAAAPDEQIPFGSGENGSSEPDVKERDFDPERDIRVGHERFADFSFGKNNMMDGWIRVKLDSEGNTENIFYSQINRYDSEEYISDDLESAVEAAAEKIISEGEDEGMVYFNDISYRFGVRTAADGKGKVVVFLDRTSEILTLNRLLMILFIIFAAATAVLFVLSWFLAKWAAAPVEDAWNRQKVFFSNASHELKTPLTVISANLDVIMSNSSETVESQKKWFDYIKSEAKKMSGLINEMLYIAREDRETDEGTTVMTDFNVSEAAEGACLAFEALAFEKGKTIVQKIEPDVYRKGDHESIVRVINILIDNAVSHSSPQSEIVVSLKKHKNKVKLSVSNKGDVIPAEDLNRIFDRYYRTDASRSADTGGFGLGLAIAKTIIEKHGGTISAVSDEEKTEFTAIW
ncbi:MAG: sensor histidine kinase [Huintestinicola sp.]